MFKLFHHLYFSDYIAKIHNLLVRAAFLRVWSLGRYHQNDLRLRFNTVATQSPDILICCVCVGPKNV